MDGVASAAKAGSSPRIRGTAKAMPFPVRALISTSFNRALESALRNLRRLLEVGQFAKDLEAGVDLIPGQRLQALGTETLDRERSHDSAVE